MKNYTVSRFYIINFLLLVLFAFGMFRCSSPDKGTNDANIIIENSEMRLVLNRNGTALSLIHKASGQECLMQGVKTPVFSVIQDRPYDNEIQLAYPAKSKTFATDSVYRVGDDLIVNFELTDYEATIGLKITDNYIGFTLKKLEYNMADFGVKRKTPIDAFTLLQLPIKDRSHFGEWLNVVWDDEVAINLLATDPHTRIDAANENGFKIMYAGGSAKVKIEGVGAALITTKKSKLLDRIDRVERDFGLPLGVESRRTKEYKNSYYELRNVTPQNIDEHIKFAKQGGFRQIVIYWMDFATSLGHFPWNSDYPNGMEDLKEVIRKIKEAGIIPGFHIHYNKTQINDAYVTPVPDNRLNLRAYFTLAKDLNKGETTITVENNPAGITMDDKRRILKVGTELVSYESYSTTPPYQFLNCKRGALNTLQVNRRSGDIIGLLDVDTWPIFVRFDQKTAIQQEAAERLAEMIKETGIRFIYFDGAEDVPRPFWYNVSNAQLIVYNALEEKPIFSEGALKSHFSWHILSRGNAFDTFAPEVIKEATRKHPLAEMKLISNDFTSINFGWIKYTVPGEKTIGIQPDMLEYVTSKAAGWNSIISLLGNIDFFKEHPRTDDNLEVIRRWEEVRATDFLSPEQKENLKNEMQEHILLIDETGDFELRPYRQITNIANKNIRAFIFERNNETWVVYWHTSGEGNLELPIDSSKISLFEELGKEIAVPNNDGITVIPVGNRRYIKFKLTPEEVVAQFSKGKLVL